MIKRVATGATPHLGDDVGDGVRQELLLAEAHRVYDTYVQPLEREHRGEYVAVSSDGHIVLAPSEIEALRSGVTTLGPGPFLFEIGRFAAVLRR